VACATKRYLLKTIQGAGNNTVTVEYAIGTAALPSGAGALAINLSSVSYNVNASGSCYKI
jgi:hypothetical protein